MKCDLCEKDFVLDENTPRELGRNFCCDDHRQKWLELYSRWLAVAYSGEGRNYALPHADMP